MIDYIDSCLPFVGRQGHVLPQAFIDVLDVYNGIVDQTAYGNRYAAEAHSVYGITHEVHCQYGDYDRHGDGYD